jgi:DNA-directed RNA polymerase subunit beta'
LRTPNVKVGDKVVKGQLITDGSANLEELLKYAGKVIAQNYIISETVSLYELQGSSVSRKHIEVVIKQMFSRSKITDSGETALLVGHVVENSHLEEVNIAAKEAGKELAQADAVVLGITEVSLSRRSFLSAASFQHTVRVLIDSSLRGAKDELKGLKENVMRGRLIPAGSGFEGARKYQMVKEVQDTIAAEMEEKGRLREEERAREAEEMAARKVKETEEEA